MRNLYVLLPDGCVPVEVWAPHPCGGYYVLDAVAYGPSGRVGRWLGERRP